jgi:hypothetical protein
MSQSLNGSETIENLLEGVADATFESTSDAINSGETETIGGTLTVEGTFTVEGTALIQTSTTTSDTTTKANTLIVEDGTTEVVGGTATIKGSVTVEGTLLVNETVGWTNAEPEIDLFWDVPTKTKFNRPQDSIYVWTPISTDIEKFSADGDSLDERPTVEVLVFSLNQRKAKQYARDVIDNLRQYMADNNRNTEFVEIEPTELGDQRNEHTTRKSDHYIFSVQFELVGLTD